MTSTVDPEAPADGGDGPSRRRRVLRIGRLAVRVGLALGLCAAVYLGVTFVQVWSASRSDDARASDAIIVLGAAQYDCRPSPVLQQRLDHALSLYEEGIAPRIVTTGGRQDGDRCTEASAGADYLIGHGVPDGDILREVQGRSTWESLAAASLILRDRDMRRAVLVTDGYHSLRVKAIAEELGLDAVVSPVTGTSAVRDLVEETGVVAVGRIVGFRRLVDIDDRLVEAAG